MDELFELLMGYDDFCSLQGVSEEQIIEAERDLKLQFANDYKAYLRRFGVVSGDGHEFTGLCSSPRLNVVQVTEEERKRNPNIKPDMYVLEKLYIDHIVIWQSSAGIIYETIQDNEPKMICPCFLDYLTL